MKKHLQTLIAFVALMTGGLLSVNAQTANVQVIHNCADPLADSVDVYVNGTLALNDFAFRSATGFLALPSGLPLNVGVAPKTSSSVNDTIKSFILGPLMSGSNYIVVASGVVGSGFAANPSGRDLAFDLKIIAPARTAAANAGEVDFAVFHGSTDAPAVDVNLTGGATLVPNAAYGAASGYLSVPPTWYAIDIAPAGNPTAVASYVADLSGLAGQSAVVIASGFLNPAANNNGAAFGLFAVLADGTFVELPAQQTANVQVIHNCADPLAAAVDVYIDGALALDNFAFRTATPFIPLLAGVNHSIAIAPPTSTSVGDALVTFPNINLMANENYTVVASGVVGTGFAANPDGRNTGFDLKILTAAQTTGSNPALVDFNVFHGATDAPGVDVRVRSGGPLLVNNAKYGDATGYLSVPASWYQLELLTEDSSAVVNTYIANLSGLAGEAATVFASGFLTPSANNNGPAFGLFVALADGTVIELPTRTTAGFQLVHNCADPLADSVDVYVNGAKFFDNSKFRTASPMIQGVLTAEFPQQIGIAPGNSASVNDTIWSTTLFFDANVNYVAIASGVVGSGFASNPDGRSTAFDVLIKTPAQALATDPANFDFFVVHGATDAPTVDVAVQGGPTIVDNAAYSDITAYLNVPASSYIIDLQNGAGTATIASYVADVTTLAAQSGIILASGFLDPAANNNGAAFGLYLVTSQGGPFAALPTFTSVEGVNEEILLSMFPNPTSGNLFINFDLKQESKNVSIEIADLSGRIVKQVLTSTSLSGVQTINADLNDLSNGTYVVRITTDATVSNTKFNIVK